MANEQNLTNPNDLVDITLLNYFEGKLGDKYASQAGLDIVRDAIGYDTATVEYVDLGLPSGTLWAKCNIGATEETEYGNYYMYGKGDRQYNSSDSAYTGTEEPLDPTKDTATVVHGAPWHMPTDEQFRELLDKTTYAWVTNFNGSGINGCKFTSKTDNTKYIFIPAAGYNSGTGSVKENGTGFVILSSTQLSEYNVSCLWHIMQVTTMGPTSRTYGGSVRPVADQAPLVKMSTKADKDYVDAKLATKANANHNHDTRYYTEAEVDALLADRTMHPIDMDEVTPSSTFTAGDVLGINGILYKAKVDTDEFPVTVVVDDTTGQFVYDTDADGNKAYVVEDYTLSEDWMKWADAGINYSLSVINSQLSYLNTLRIASRLGTLEASQSNILTALTQIQQALMPITVDGVTYSVRDILTELAKLMNANIVIDEGENQDANSEEE